MQACVEPARLWPGLQELLINAVEHGNLGISYAEKSLLMLKNRLHNEIERRVQDPAYSQLQASVHLMRDADGLSLTIQDQGQGFAWQDFLEFSPERAFDCTVGASPSPAPASMPSSTQAAATRSG